ncbi:MAG: hypothetical protein WCX82_03510 [archaeon]|jgi:hypothetical protein
MIISHGMNFLKVKFHNLNLLKWLINSDIIKIETSNGEGYINELQIDPISIRRKIEYTNNYYISTSPLNFSHVIALLTYYCKKEDLDINVGFLFHSYYYTLVTVGNYEFIIESEVPNHFESYQTTKNEITICTQCNINASNITYDTQDFDCICDVCRNKKVKDKEKIKAAQIAYKLIYQ